MSRQAWKLVPYLVLACMRCGVAEAQSTTVLSNQSLMAPSTDTANTASVWADKIQENDALFSDNPNVSTSGGHHAPFFAESAFFQTGGRQVFVTVGSSLSTCDNDNSGTQDYGLCDVRIVVLNKGHATTSDAGKACFVTPSDTADVANATLSPDGSNVTFSATVGGAPVPACNVTVPIP